MKLSNSYQHISPGHTGVMAGLINVYALEFVLTDTEDCCFQGVQGDDIQITSSIWLKGVAIIF